MSTILAIREWGATGLALNFATLRAVLAGESGDGWSKRMQAVVARHLSSSMQIESLWKHNAKYRPAWQPRFAVLRRGRAHGGRRRWPSPAPSRSGSFRFIGRFLQPSPDAQEIEAEATPDLPREPVPT